MLAHNIVPHQHSEEEHNQLQESFISIHEEHHDHDHEDHQDEEHSHELQQNDHQHNGDLVHALAHFVHSDITFNIKSSTAQLSVTYSDDYLDIHRYSFSFEKVVVPKILRGHYFPAWNSNYLGCCPSSRSLRAPPVLA